MNPGSLADIEEIDFAITMATWWVVAIDRELLARNTLNTKFFKGCDARYTSSVAVLEKKRSDGIAFVKIFRQRGERLIVDEKTEQTETQFNKAADAWRTGWVGKRDHWERHLRTLRRP